MDDSGNNDQSMDALDPMDDFSMDDNIESELSDVKSPLILKSNHSTPVGGSTAFHAFDYINKSIFSSTIESAQNLVFC